RALVATGGFVGICEGTIRVALSRLVADGDLVAAEGCYELSGAFVRRQEALDAGRSPATRRWRGRWEILTADADLSGWHLGRLRDGVWVRPDNLQRPAPAADAAFVGRLDGDGAALAGRLWDLAGWADRARGLLDEVADPGDPARRFALAAAVARHLRDDPLLPPALLPAQWPGPALRRAYRGYEAELNRLLRG
ncbi:MAG: PaaX family transcriptional regulator C-terminal domain-containing protein, partial [Acidimicrobiales bacterium]